MPSMRVLLLSSTMMLGSAAAALAADAIYEEPPAPAAPDVDTGPTYGWSGLYMGLQAGAAFNPDAGTFDYAAGSGAAFPATAFSSNSGNSDDFAFIGGAHIGYDHQIGSFIVGALADINYVDASAVSGFTLGTNATGLDTYGVEQKINFVATARGKLGFAMDRVAVYGTGGIAYADTTSDFSRPNSVTATRGYAASVNSKNDDFGFAVGAGVDYLVTDNISFGLEYLYTDLGKSKVDVTYTNAGLPAGAQTFEAKSSTDLAYHSVFAKASYRFN